MWVFTCVYSKDRDFGTVYEVSYRWLLVYMLADTMFSNRLSLLMRIPGYYRVASWLLNTAYDHFRELSDVNLTPEQFKAIDPKGAWWRDDSDD